MTPVLRAVRERRLPFRNTGGVHGVQLLPLDAAAWMEFERVNMDPPDTERDLSSAEFREFLTQAAQSDCSIEPIRSVDTAFYVGLGAFAIYWILMVFGLLPGSSRTNPQLNDAVRDNRLAWSAAIGDLQKRLGPLRIAQRPQKILA